LNARSSNQESSLPAPIFLLPAPSIPFQWTCLEAVVASLTGHMNNAGSADEDLETTESMHLCVIPSVSNIGIKESQDFRVLTESLRLLSTCCDKNLLVLEMRLSLE
ncbi:hypothetical protein V8G54_037052, partial [Vigna mungo]